MQLQGAPNSRSARRDSPQFADQEIGVPKRRPAFALITLIPLVWLLSVTFTAGLEKIFHSDPRIGFIAGAKAERAKLADSDRKAKVGNDAMAGEVFLSKIAEQENKSRKLVFNLLLDAAVAGTFLLLVSVIVVLSVREWILLWSRRKPAVLHETEPVYLPDYAVTEGGKPMSALGAAAIAFTVAKELSGESQLERARQQAAVCECATCAPSPVKSPEQIYLEVTEQRFNGVRRCC
jgi:carbon starvation protein